MALDLTHGSAMAYETIIYGNMTPQMAAQYLREERILVRSFPETLRQMYTHEDIQRRLRQFYHDILPDDRQRSVDRKLQNWLTGQNLPTNREDYFRIAFALSLSEAQLNYILGMCTDYAVQYRDGREAVLAWFLRNGCEYQEAVAFLEGLPCAEEDNDISLSSEEKCITQEKRAAGTIGKDTDAIRKAVETIGKDTDAIRKAAGTVGIDTDTIRKAADIIGKDTDTIRKAAGTIEKDTDGYTETSRITHEIRNEFQLARTTEELRDCFLRNRHRFGRMHLRSYYYFRQYLRQLIQPASVSGESETDYSIGTVMDTYLTLRMPVGKKRSNYSLVQRLIKHNWPNVTSIKRIRSRMEDVPRKLLLLLYVVTENSDYRSGYSEFDEDYVSLEDRVEDHWWTLNAMLADCGMAPLDLRNAFDWLILYAVSTDGEESMSGRLEGVINELFKNVDKQA